MPLGIFNLSPAEILVLLTGFLCLSAVIGGAVIAVMLAHRRRGMDTPSVSMLQAENKRLREEIARLKQGRRG
jgi:hypothetical protein